MSDGMVLRIRSLEVDLPRSVGFYGGITAAVLAGVIEPPLGIIMACVPITKMALNSRAPSALRWIGEVLDGAVKPVGGDAQGTVRLADPAQSMSEAAHTVAMAARASTQTKTQAGKQADADTDSVGR